MLATVAADRPRPAAGTTSSTLARRRSVVTSRRSARIGPEVTALRALMFERHHWAMAIIALALLVRAMIPAGYMVASTPLTLSVQICSEVQGGTARTDIVVPMAPDHQQQSGSHDQNGAPCAFSALGMASLAGTPAPFVAIALAFILAIAATTTVPTWRRQIAHLRPPLRGPPPFA